MTYLRGLKEMGLELNPPHLGDWPYRIGQYMINFGGIELLSYQHLALLEPTREDFERNTDRLLSGRIDQIQKLLTQEGRHQEVKGTDLIQLWEEVRELAKWRNRIAHNPVLPTWKPGTDSSRDPPDVMGVPDMRQLKGSNETNSISLEGIVFLIDACVDIGKRLHVATEWIRSREP